MSFLELFGAFVLLYNLLYLIIPMFLDCDMRLYLKEKFGKPKDSLAGKVIWIIGASSGIGEHTAYALANAGCKLIISARRTDLLQKVKEKCVIENNEKLTGNDILILPFDILDLNVHQKMFDIILQKFGKLDILVHNTGRSQRANWENIDINVDKEAFELNVFSIVNLTRVVLKYFIKQGKGHVAVNSSIAGIMGIPFSASYTGSKHALHGYFECLRTEKSISNISVTMIVPGPIQTDFLPESFTDTIGEKFGQKTPIASSKLSPKRCGELIAIALANELNEVWISFSPPLFLSYLKFYPNLGRLISNLLGPTFHQRLRDSKTTVNQ
ncbi:dehydrogenase/reductase SDR family member 7 [Leptopilina boulardi]|uniref:dehydrogenase/reductase SDR family member 7 n=1 Tax=Leptopilina boulardi TaxID=63433 RepID=UPI0021F582C0|nr:dehydrogenase/reductase SDR family member 7 [Leptopilina boulardi]XP_051163624.1 dehydrogenase/reductase SDR family member 7 [Leptopilina boulardi]XP_051163625.1 dehydrogenase/reductase SDR family member 7 [Leptopilina boulardi]